ncbi:GlxA family transcriptional regulator [Endozoicomonadaceae bacterium StTr2]
MSLSEKPINVALLAFENISAFHISVPCLVFQDAIQDKSPGFELKICTENNNHLLTSSGLGITVEHDFQALEQAQVIVIPSWPNDLPEPGFRLLLALKRHHERGALMVGLCLGSYVLACAGLLDGKRMTTHWEFASEFQSRFPNVEVDPAPLFIEYEQIITSAGTAASLDCCLHIVRRYYGSEFANKLARRMVTAPFRSGGQRQYIPALVNVKLSAENSLGRIIEDVEENLTRHHSLDDVARRCAMSTRTFSRQFKSAYGCTFNKWLLNQRLLLSQRLLETTQSSVSRVAELAGFGSESVFCKHFRAAFHVSPTQWRTSFKHSSCST